MRIAPLLASEHARWLELWLAYQDFYGVSLDAAATAATWKKIQLGRVHGLAAHDAAGRIVGIVHYLFHEDTWSLQPACYLQDLYVEPDARAAGYGRKLIESVGEAARQAGANPPYWLTHETNLVARRLYDRVGKNNGFIQYSYAG
jgi:GNAT superfamily N-acetyltransferase